MRTTPSVLRLLLAIACARSASSQTWISDNGNGTYTNPLFYDEFSDPDLIRVGTDFYLTGTTMHSMPGLPILRSRDLVNWTFLGYALDKLDLGPAFHLENGQNIYGQGIWAPCLRFNKGAFYIFSNVNRQTTQLFRATNPAGPWTRTPMKKSLHDLSVLFDDDGKIWVVWGYRGIRIAQLSDDLTDTLPGTERELIPPSAGMGEGLHFYKINGKYLLTSAWFMDEMRMPVGRAGKLEGPWEVNQNISRGEDFGVVQGYRTAGRGPNASTPGGGMKLNDPNPSAHGRLAMHQGGVVDTPTGEWWGFSMLDSNSIGRLTALSPVIWTNGWPYFGLPGNLGRTPRIWVKPNTGAADPPHAPYRRDDDFSGPLQAVWQWNHIPDDGKWSLTERPGFLRLRAIAADSLWTARNTLTQRAIGPQSRPTVVLETKGMKIGDVAGFALFNRPYSWLGVERNPEGLVLAQYDEQTGQTVRVPLTAQRVWLRASSDFLDNLTQFAYSTDGKTFSDVGPKVKMTFTLTTFQGVRDSLFSYNRNGIEGGYADFDSFIMNETSPHGLTRPIPYGKQIMLAPHAHTPQAAVVCQQGALSTGRDAGAGLTVVKKDLGRLSLRCADGFVSVAPDGAVSLRKQGPGETFQWIETFTGELTLLSITTSRYLRVDFETGKLLADKPGPLPDGTDGVRFDWKVLQ